MGKCVECGKNKANHWDDKFCEDCYKEILTQSQQDNAEVK